MYIYYKKNYYIFEINKKTRRISIFIFLEQLNKINVN